MKNIAPRRCWCNTSKREGSAGAIRPRRLRVSRSQRIKVIRGKQRPSRKKCGDSRHRLCSRGSGEIVLTVIFSPFSVILWPSRHRSVHLRKHQEERLQLPMAHFVMSDPDCAVLTISHTACPAASAPTAECNCCVRPGERENHFKLAVYQRYRDFSPCCATFYARPLLSETAPWERKALSRTRRLGQSSQISRSSTMRLRAPCRG